MKMCTYTDYYYYRDNRFDGDINNVELFQRELMTEFADITEYRSDWRTVM